MLAFDQLAPLTDSGLVLVILIVVAAAAWIGWVLGFDFGKRRAADHINAQLRRTLNLPPRPQR